MPRCLALLLLAALPAGAAIPEPDGLATRLRASPAEEPAFALSAEGVHIFECRPVSADGRYAWVFTAPDAMLYEGSRSAASHRTPNLWESLSDRSSVSGVVRATQPAGSENLPWALFRAQPIGASGLFAGVTSVQRVNTSGGVAPAEGCGPDDEGSELQVPFTAEYYFYRPIGAG